MASSQQDREGRALPAAAPARRSTLACRACGGRVLEPLGRVKGYDFVECATCAFAFAPAITPRVLEELYAKGYHGPEEGAPEAGWAPDEAEFLAPALERLGEGPLRILDFGTGQSRVPDALRAMGHRCVAVDVAPPEREHPDRLTGNLLDLDLPPSFDLAYSYQVFEHLPEPRPYLRRLLALTRPEGFVLVHTDMETREREEGFTKWWYVTPPDHCSFYRHRTFDAMLAGTPHRVVHRSPEVVLVRKAAGGPALQAASEGGV